MDEICSYVCDEDPVRASEGSAAWSRRYAVVPGRGATRWLIPVVSSKVTGAGLVLHPPFRRRSRIALGLARASVRLGLVRRLCRTVVVTRSRPPWVERAVSEIVGIPCVLAFMAGGSLGRAKVVAAAIDESGRLRAFVKLARTEIRRAAVLREKDALRHLAGRDVAPAFLGDASEDGACLVAQAPLAGSVGAGSGAAEHALLARLRLAVPVPLCTTTWAVELEAAVSAARVPETGAFQVLSGVVAGTVVRPAVVHGDLAPWNLRIQAGRARAIDWEWWNASGPPLVDAAHHVLQNAFLLEHASADAAFDRLVTLVRSSEPDLGQRVAFAVCGLGMVEYLLRRRADGYPDDDALARRYRATLVHVLGASAGLS